MGLRSQWTDRQLHILTELGELSLEEWIADLGHMSKPKAHFALRTHLAPSRPGTHDEVGEVDATAG